LACIHKEKNPGDFPSAGKANAGGGFSSEGFHSNPAF